MTTNEKLAILRQKMANAGLDAYIVLHSDPHMSEYIAEHYKFRAYLSGFTGSAGTVVVTKEKSGLWTDGRYYIQAEKQLSESEIELHRAYDPGVKGYVDWLCDELGEGSVVGVNGALASQRNFENMTEKFKKRGITLNVTHDFSDMWKNRPSLPKSRVINHDVKFAGESTKDKLIRVREEMAKKGVTDYAICALDSIMWLYNIRANDIKCCPEAISYALIGKDYANFYVATEQMTDEVRKVLAENGVTVRGYGEIYTDVKALGKDAMLGADYNRTNCLLFDGAECQKKNIADIAYSFKSVKNETENECLKECYLRDCAALVKSFKWIFENLDNAITECDVADKLEEERTKQKNNMGISFETIAAYRENAAMMHYMPTKESCATLSKSGMLLIDSGGQYLDGTTDITRTLILGGISPEERRDFTLVLKGNIALMRAVFLKGATGANLDVLARNPLWQYGIDYKCGTGHGVGFFLNVHEGPQAFNQSMSNNTPLKAGMNLTVEPGVYLEGRYGIRTENDVIVTPYMTTEHGEFLHFEILSYCPIDANGIDKLYLTPDEIDYVNDFNRVCREKLAPYLTDDENAWLAGFAREI